MRALDAVHENNIIGRARASLAAKYKLNCVACDGRGVDVDGTAALTKIGFAFKYYFRRETRKAKTRCPTRDGKSSPNEQQRVTRAVHKLTVVPRQRVHEPTARRRRRRRRDKGELIFVFRRALVFRFKKRPVPLCLLFGLQWSPSAVGTYAHGPFYLHLCLDKHRFSIFSN